MTNNVLMGTLNPTNSLTAAVATTSVTLSSDKIQDGNILVPADLGPPGKWPGREREFP